MKLNMKWLPILLLFGQLSASGINQFGFDLKEQLNSRENLLLSPFSISSALAMAATGANGATYNEMAKVLYLPEDREESDEQFRTLLEHLTQGDQKSNDVILEIHNSLWMQTGGQFFPLYQQRVVRDYQGILRQADFENDPDEASVEINRTVAKETKGRIRNLFKKGQIDALTRVVLVNTVYLKAPFASPFDQAHTRDRPFTTSDQKEVSVKMMYQKGWFPYMEGKDYKALEIPYVADEKELALIIVLPDHWQKPLDLSREFPHIQDELKRSYVEVHLPKFTVKSELSLVKPLKAMGMKLPFSGNADFSLISDDEQLFLSAVNTEAILTIDEAGSLATAATGATIGVKSAPPTEVIPFVADSPFYFFILDKKLNTILFMGELLHPGN